ncbi:unnamed protein product, partial [Acanthoscelides obtectus]
MAQSVLIRKRGTIKAKLAHFEKFLNSVQPQDLDRQTIIHMQERCTKFETLFDSFDEIQSEIECESDNPEACYAEREDFETKFYLQLSRAKLSVTQVDEINDTHNESNEVKVGATQCTLVAAQNALLATAQVDVTDKITSMVPDNNIPIQHFNLPVNIKLADPEFNVTRNIDILIGADVFWQILESERINISKDLPILQNTKLGWVLAGPLSMPVTKTQCHLSVTDPLQNQLRKFWELEEIPFDSPAWSPEERLCEKHFIENLQVLENGRFMVSLPFKESPDKLGHSREGFDSVNSNHLVDFTSKDDLTSKTLGLVWRPESDILTYKIHSETNHTANITKRQILSKISTIFDPLGLLSPCVIKAKVLLQSLWAESIAWDTPLPVDMRKSWLSLAEDLNILNKLIINRKVVCDKATAISMHAFADASEKSYGACVYIVSENASGNKTANLLCAKSKVAPIKSQSMPRLELCAALVASQLIAKISKSIDTSFSSIHCWTDSTIVLGWLKSNPSTLKPFVANRVSEIQRLTESIEWHHVSTLDNPADIVSRGLSPSSLMHSKLWFHGPDWLLYLDQWPTSPILLSELPEQRK